MLVVADCYAFSPGQRGQLQSTSYWKECPDQSWSLYASHQLSAVDLTCLLEPIACDYRSNCCPAGLTEQYFYEHQPMDRANAKIEKI